MGDKSKGMQRAVLSQAGIGNQGSPVGCWVVGGAWELDWLVSC